MSKVINKYFEVEEGSAYNRLGNKVIQLELVSLTDEGQKQTELTIPVGVTKIGKNVFYGNKSLKSITISKTVEKFGNFAFANCSILESVSFEPNSQLEVIYDFVFKDCKQLKKISFPKNLAYIGRWAFFNCSSLKFLSLEEDFKLSGINAGAFYGCTSLQSITIPEPVDFIGDYAFGDCISLKSITFCSNVYNLGSHVFYNCSSLEKIAFLYFIPEINDYSFSDCSPIVKYFVIDDKSQQLLLYSKSNIQSSQILIKPIIDKEKQKYFIFESRSVVGLTPEGKKQTELVIPTGIKYIYWDAFKNNTVLESITIPKSVKEIGDRAFYGCAKLTSVTFEEGSQLQEIGDNAFMDCPSLKSITIPKSVEHIEEGTFSFCTNLKSVTFEKDSHLKEINDYVFALCTSLQSIVIPNSVTFIGQQAFQDCRKLESVTFEEGSHLQEIGAFAFKGCKLLTQIVIPFLVKLIGLGAFDDCKKITSKIKYTKSHWKWVEKQIEKWKKHSKFEYYFSNNIKKKYESFEDDIFNYFILNNIDSVTNEQKISYDKLLFSVTKKIDKLYNLFVKNNMDSNKEKSFVFKMIQENVLKDMNDFYEKMREEKPWDYDD